MGHLYDEFYWKWNNFLRYLSKFEFLDVLILTSMINIFLSFSFSPFLFLFPNLSLTTPII